MAYFGQTSSSPPRQHGVRLLPVQWNRQIGQDYGVACVWIGWDKLPKDAPDHSVKATPVPYIEDLRFMPFDQLHYHPPQGGTDRIRTVTVSEKCTDSHMNASLYRIIPENG